MTRNQDRQNRQNRAIAVDADRGTTVISPLDAALSARLFGQRRAIDAIVPYVEVARAGLAPEGRPAGVFLLLGPSGTGKTKTVEALADVLHGSEKNVLRVDCGEFQLEHEVAKLIGAPPGYLGHRETVPLMSQAKLNSVTSARSSLSIVLFDEIEKAAPSMVRLLLGVLDKATLRLGDNIVVNFERSLIFMTSNLGAREMGAARGTAWGLGAGTGAGAGAAGAATAATDMEAAAKLGRTIERIGQRAVRRAFSPEFVNRIDEIVVYEALTEEGLERILDGYVSDWEKMLAARIGPGVGVWGLDVTPAAKKWLLAEAQARAGAGGGGTGGGGAGLNARELRRVMQRCVFQPLGRMIAQALGEAGYDAGEVGKALGVKNGVITVGLNFVREGPWAQAQAQEPRVKRAGAGFDGDGGVG